MTTPDYASTTQQWDWQMLQLDVLRRQGDVDGWRALYRKLIRQLEQRLVRMEQENFNQ